MDKRCIIWDYIDLRIKSFPIDTMCHNVVEVVSCDESIIIKVGFLEHVLEFFIIKLFS